MEAEERYKAPLPNGGGEAFDPGVKPSKRAEHKARALQRDRGELPLDEVAEAPWSVA